MPHYLMKFSYTPEAWARLIRKPEDRREVARSVIEKLGGALHGFWYGFGEHDGYVLIEAVSAVAVPATTVSVGPVMDAVGWAKIRTVSTVVCVPPPLTTVSRTR